MKVPTYVIHIPLIRFYFGERWVKAFKLLILEFKDEIHQFVLEKIHSKTNSATSQPWWISPQLQTYFSPEM